VDEIALIHTTRARIRACVIFKSALPGSDRICDSARFPSEIHHERSGYQREMQRHDGAKGAIRVREIARDAIGRAITVERIERYVHALTVSRIN